MPLKIRIYWDDTVALEGIFSGLQRSFPGSDIAIVRARDIGSDFRFDLFCLPGIRGERCTYPRDITPDKLNIIHQQIRQGACSLFICAGSQVMSERYYYQSCGTAGSLSGSNPQAMFRAVSYAPLRNYGRPADPLHSHADTVAVPVRYKTIGGSWVSLKVAYGNGGYWRYSDLSDEMEAIALYNAGDGDLVAAAAAPHGNGLALGMGILPYLGPIPVTEKGDPRIYRLSEELKPFEQLRHNFWENTLMHRIKTHLHCRGRYVAFGHSLFMGRNFHDTP